MKCDHGGQVASYCDLCEKEFYWKTKAEERLIKAALEHACNLNGGCNYPLCVAAVAVRKERKKK